MVILQLTVAEAITLADVFSFLEGMDDGLTPGEESIQRKLYATLRDLEEVDGDS